VLTFNLTWTGSAQVTVSAPIGGTGQVERQSAATVTGSVVDLGGNTLFSGSDATQADIAEVIHTLG
jgi:alpha-D-ribose 1-methylphosphonate 5-triphosphate synthase subunit PhnG